MEDERRTLGEEIAAIGLKRGEFVLSSGQISDRYWDKSLFLGKPEILRQISKHMVKLLPADIEVLAGPVVWGVTLAVSLALETGLPYVVVRNEEKRYGTRKLIEGGEEVRDKKVVIVDDIVTSGKATKAAALKLRNNGAYVDTAICVLERQGFKADELKAMGIVVISLFREAELALTARGSSVIILNIPFAVNLIHD